MRLDVDIAVVREGFSLTLKGQMTAGITGLFGPSGAGKTTLLYCIAGLYRPDRGRIVLNNIVLFDRRKKIDLPAQKRRIGFVFQDHLLFPHLSVEQNLGYGQKETSGRRRSRLLEIADVLSIGALLKRGIHQLSGGEKQRVALGRAILSSPDLLLLDEPFSALDHELKRELICHLKRLYAATEVPMILVSHDPDEMTEMAEELFLIRDGIFFSQGSFNFSCRYGINFSPWQKAKRRL